MKAYKIFAKKAGTNGHTIKAKVSPHATVLLSAFDDLAALAESTKDKKKELLDKITAAWVQNMGLAEMKQGKAREEVDRRVLHKFAEMASVMAPQRPWNADELLQRFEARRVDKIPLAAQLKSFLRNELDKIQ